MESLVNDLSAITETRKKVFEKLSQNANYCICDYLEKTILNNEKVCNIDIGIGNLLIGIDDGTVRYKFVPSNELESCIISTLENQQNVLIAAVDKQLISQLNKLYEKLL